MPVNKLWISRETLTDGSFVFDGAATLNLDFVTEDDAFRFVAELRALVAACTNNDLEVRYNPARIAHAEPI